MRYTPENNEVITYYYAEAFHPDGRIERISNDNPNCASVQKKARHFRNKFGVRTVVVEVTKEITVKKTICVHNRYEPNNDVDVKREGYDESS